MREKLKSKMSKKYLAILPIILLIGIAVGQALEHTTRMSNREEFSINVIDDPPFDLAIFGTVTEEINNWEYDWIDEFLMLRLTNPSDSGLNKIPALWVMIEMVGISNSSVAMRCDVYNGGDWHNDTMFEFSQLDNHTIEGGIIPIPGLVMRPGDYLTYIFDINIDRNAPLGLWNFTYWAEMN